MTYEIKILLLLLEEHTSGVIINSISDHQMIYTYKNVEIQHIKACTNRYIEIERNDPHSIQYFVTKFQDFNLQNKLDLSEDADPNENFNLFMQTFSTFKEKYLLKRKVKFNKRKHRTDCSIQLTPKTNFINYSKPLLTHQIISN